MKVYGLPTELEATIPTFVSSESATRNDWRISEHRTAIKDWAKANGYTGKNTGRVLSLPKVDGFAEYMLIEGSKSFLFHLPYGDAWHEPLVDGLTKKAVLARLDASDRRKRLFAKAA